MVVSTALSRAGAQTRIRVAVGEQALNPLPKVRCSARPMEMDQALSNTTSRAVSPSRAGRLRERRVGGDIVQTNTTSAAREPLGTGALIDPFVHRFVKGPVGAA